MFSSTFDDKRWTINYLTNFYQKTFIIKESMQTMHIIIWYYLCNASVIILNRLKVYLAFFMPRKYALTIFFDLSHNHHINILSVTQVNESVLLHHVEFYMWNDVNALSKCLIILRMYRSYLNLARAHTNYRDRCTCKCSERIFPETRRRGLQWNNGPLISKIKTDAYFFYDSDTNLTWP